MPLVDPVKKREYMARYRAKHHDRLTKNRREYYYKLRLKVLSHYAGGKIECKCCGEDEYRFMSLDHINNNGAEHRRELGSKYIFSWLNKNGLPPGYQVLCHNCNMAKGFYGICPHKEKLVKEEIYV